MSVVQNSVRDLALLQREAVDLMYQFLDLSGRTYKYRIHLQIMTHCQIPPNTLYRETLALRQKVSALADKIQSVANPIIANAFANMEAACIRLCSDMMHIHQLQPIFRHLSQIEEQLHGLCLLTQEQNEKRALDPVIEDECYQLRVSFTSVRTQIEYARAQIETAGYPPDLDDLQTALDLLYDVYKKVDAVAITCGILPP